MKKNRPIHMKLFVGLCAPVFVMSLVLSASQVLGAPPVISGCSVFQADNIWNVPVDTLPVASNSAAFIASIGETTGVHPDFGAEWEGTPIGIPYNVVGGSQAKVSVSFEYEGESDPGPYPIPSNPLIEGGSDSDGDRHILILDKDNCVLYELYSAYPPEGSGGWTAGSGAIYDLKSNALRHDGWTSADAAGLPILPGLVRYDETASGEITHALRFTAAETRGSYVWPARHEASDLTGPGYPPMGQRFRLKQSFDVSGFSSEVKVILKALKKYGMILADNGSNWYLSGVPDERWNNDALVGELKLVKGSDFEAVDVSSLMVDPDSAQALAAEPAPNINPPDRNVRLIFIHHSCGENWLNDTNGGLGIALRNNKYYVSDTNYGWGPSGIGDYTDIGHWWLWFRGPERTSYLSALYAEAEQHSSYSRLAVDPGGQNQIVMFKSCYPNSEVQGSPSDPIPPIASNPLKGEGSGSEYHTLSNAKGIYKDLLNYFKTKRDKLFIVITAPPLRYSSNAANARALNKWLVNTWLDNYPYKNVFVFDFYNVLTTNNGTPNKNDLGLETGNHHRWRNGAIQYITDGDNDSSSNLSEYWTGDDHPSKAGNLKATGEFLKLLNIAYNRWRPAIGVAVDNTGLTWTSGGAAKWFGETASGHKGANAAQSGAIADGKTSWLKTTVTGPGTLRFYWRVSSEANKDFLKFKLDGVLKHKISGTVGWAQKTYSIGAGTHTLIWTYEKNASGKAGSDAAWVDQVEWTGS